MIKRSNSAKWFSGEVILQASFYNVARHHVNYVHGDIVSYMQCKIVEVLIFHADKFNHEMLAISQSVIFKIPRSQYIGFG